MAHGLLHVAMRDQRLVRRMRIILLGVVFGRLAMMHRRPFMMIGGGVVVFGPP